jgi:hypothetical protein
MGIAKGERVTMRAKEQTGEQGWKARNDAIGMCRDGLRKVPSRPRLQASSFNAQREDKREEKDAVNEEMVRNQERDELN